MIKGPTITSIDGAPITEAEFAAFAEIEQLENGNNKGAVSAYDKYKDFFPRYNQYKRLKAQAVSGNIENNPNIEAIAAPAPQTLLFTSLKPTDADLVKSPPKANAGIIRAAPLNRDLISMQKEKQLAKEEQQQKDTKKKTGCCPMM